MARHPRQWPRPIGRPATWDDLAEIPEQLIGEIVDGQIVVSPRPGAPHARAATDLGTLLGAPFRFGQGGPGGWIFLHEPRLRFASGDVRVPDLAGWRRERWPGDPRRGPIELRPDWICEVISRSTETEDRTVKFALYARAEIGHYWLLSPRARTLEVFRREGDGWRLAGAFDDKTPVRAEPFEAIALDLSQLWDPPSPDDATAFDDE